MTSYQCSIVSICLTSFVFKLYPLKIHHKPFDLENIGQGQIQGNQIEAHIGLPIHH